jgi:hypothetical protein
LTWRTQVRLLCASTRYVFDVDNLIMSATGRDVDLRFSMSPSPSSPRCQLYLVQYRLSRDEKENLTCTAHHINAVREVSRRLHQNSANSEIKYLRNMYCTVKIEQKSWYRRG